MKSIYSILILFLLTTLIANAQEEVELKVGNVYYFSSPRAQLLSEQYPVSDISNWKKDKPIEVKWGAYVVVQQFDSEKVFFSYVRYSGTSTDKGKSDISNLQKTYNDDNPLFAMSVADFKNSVKTLYKRFKDPSIGVYTVPFRFRGYKESFDFESALTLQTNLVLGFGSRKQKESTFDTSIGLGLTSIGLTPNNSNVTAGRTASAITFSLGVVGKFNRFINLGLFLGKDYLALRDRDVSWRYNKRVWAGFGINISFNSIQTQKSPTVDEQPQAAF